MSPAQAPQTPSWPPLITGARLPRWITVRDVVLTLLAWCVLGFLLRDSIYLLWDYLRHPIFELTTAQAPDWGTLWGRLDSFVILSAGLIVLLCLWAVIDRRRLLTATQTPQPEALSIAEHAARAGVEEKDVREARGFKVTNVRFREDGTIAGFEEVTREVV